MDKKNYYETLYVIDGTLSDDAIAALVEKFTALIGQHGTVIEVDTDNWGKRRLAYPIEDKNEGYYVLTKFESSPEFPNELERVFGITEGIFRAVVTAPKKAAAQPAAAE
jgi:small subunit ribosomal protein S6